MRVQVAPRAMEESGQPEVNEADILVEKVSGVESSAEVKCGFTWFQSCEKTHWGNPAGCDTRLQEVMQKKGFIGLKQVSG